MSIDDATAADWDRISKKSQQRQQWWEQAEKQKIKSDGGSSPYYLLPEGCVDLDDIIVKKNMPWHIANIFKACYRYGEKAGHDELYDARKIQWFIEREIQHLTED